MKNKQQVIDQLKFNPIVQIACQKSGVSRATFYRWRSEDKDFKKQTETAIKDGVLLINDLAESQLLAAIKEQNLTAIIFWLKNHHTDYADKIQVSTDQKPIDNNLTPEEEKLVKKALQMAGVINSPLKHDQRTSEHKSDNK
jgi:ACT domain-containing protein